MCYHSKVLNKNMKKKKRKKRRPKMMSSSSTQTTAQIRFKAQQLARFKKEKENYEKKKSKMSWLSRVRHFMKAKKSFKVVPLS